MFDLRKSVFFGMALLVLSVPILDCALPGQQMSQEEQTCCLQMADECGNTQMEESHTCCNKLPHANAAVFQVRSVYAPVTLDYAVQIAPNPQPDVTTMVAIVVADVNALPESPPGRPSVLRI